MKQNQANVPLKPNDIKGLKKRVLFLFLKTFNKLFKLVTLNKNLTENM